MAFNESEVQMRQGHLELNKNGSKNLQKIDHCAPSFKFHPYDEHTRTTTSQYSNPQKESTIHIN